MNDELKALIDGYGRACRRDGNPAWESQEGVALAAYLASSPAADESAKPDISSLAEIASDTRYSNEYIGNAFRLLVRNVPATVAGKEVVTLTYPEVLTPELREVLGWMCFQCISLAQCMRADGVEIAKRAEDEQAVVLHWLTKFVLKHGEEWRTHAGEALKAMRERVAQRSASKAEPTS